MKTLLLLAALAVVAPPARAQSAAGDSLVTAKTKIALFSDERVKGTEIGVETKQGLVILTGKVDTEAAKTASAEIAKSVDGAASVKNELQVVPRADRKAVEATDEALTAAVRKALRGSRFAGVAVKTNAGVVSLSGTVGGMETSAKASWKAWSVGGVKSVKNDLSVVAKK